MKIRLNIDSVGLKEKPPKDSNLIRIIRNRVCNADSIAELEVSELIGKVAEGYTFTPSVMTGTRGDSWQSQQIVCADIDNDSGEKDADGNHIMIDNPLKPEEALAVMREHKITPSFMYYSFSHSERWPKFRVVLILPDPMTDPDTAQDAVKRFTHMFNTARYHCADTAVADKARMFYGSKPESVFFTSEETTPRYVLLGLPEADKPAKPPRSPIQPGEGAQWHKPTAKPSGGKYRPYSDLLAQFNYDKEHFDLAGYVRATTNSRPHMKGKSLFFNPCPICTHDDDFTVDGHLFYCHGANGRLGGSIIDYLMHKHGEERTQADAIEYFKYDIMGYDREEWKKSYDAYIHPERKTETEDVRPVLTTTHISDFITSGAYDANIEYFRRYKDRKLGIHTEIDKHLTLYPGLAVLGGASSLGKTTFAVNCIDKLLKRGETVLYFSLEQLPIEIATKSLARELYDRNPFTPLTNTDIKNGGTCPDLEEVKRDYARQAGRYEIITGSFHTTARDIVDYVESYMKGHSCTPVVVVDYLQLIAPPDGFRGGVREYTDENLKALKDMQKRNGLFVLAISSFNRSSNYDPVSYESFKETGMIEFTCDYVWGLQLAVLDAENDDFYLKATKTGTLGTGESPLYEKRRKVNEAQSQIPKKVEFISLKSRNGKQFYKALFDYYPQYDCYRETRTSYVAVSEGNPFAGRKMKTV